MSKRPTRASCGVIAEATLLQDRLDVIVALAEEARTSYLQDADVISGVSVSAALETIRVLARSITEDDNLKGSAFMAPGRRSGAVGGSQAEEGGGCSSARPRQERPTPPSLRTVPGNE